MIVMKFGGTSVEDERAIKRAAGIVRKRLREQPVVVVSALAGVTNTLLEMSQLAASGRIEEALKAARRLRRRHLELLTKLVEVASKARVCSVVQRLFASLEEMLRGIAALGELTPRTTDHVLGTGELLSSHIVAAAFEASGIDAAWVDSCDCIVTDASYTGALPRLDETAERLSTQVSPLVSAGRVPVMAGFIGATAEGIPTTLGRGGSDFSAAIVGAALNARRIEIWTDVEGMMTTDPRICGRAQRIDLISFDEAAELAYFGAKVLHPATLIPALQRNIPVHVLNSLNPKSEGTCIRSSAPRSRTTFRAIAAKRMIKVINIRSPRMLGAKGFLRGIFESLERHGCEADLVSTSEVGVSVALQASQSFELLVQDLRKLGEVEVEDGKAIICLVGKDIRGRIGIAANVFNTIAAANINVHMISQGASEINVGFVIEDENVPEAVRQLHRRFFEIEAAELAADVPPISAAFPGQTCVEQMGAQPEVG